MTETAKPAAPVAKSVKIKLLRECLIGKEIKKIGTVISVDEELAKELCDTKFKGYPPFYGYKPSFDGLMEGDPLAEKKIVRAVRVA